MSNNKHRLYLYENQDEEFDFLEGEGYSGSLNDMIFAYLGSLGLVGELTDRLLAYHDGGGTSVGAGNVLLEIGDIILLESGDNLLLDNNI